MKSFHVAAWVVGGALLAWGAAGLRADQETTCPVSGHKVTVTDKTATLTVNGQKQYFCCENCPAAFAKDPGKYIKTAMSCPVMTNNKVNLSSGPRVAINDNLLVSCCGGCPNQITSHPEKYVKETRDPVTGATFKPTADSPRSEFKGVHYLFASADSKKTFDAEPDKYANKWLSKAS